MKNFLLIAAFFLFMTDFSPVFSQTNPEKLPDVSEFSLNGSRSQQIFGQYNDLTPIFSRSYGYTGDYNGTCQNFPGVYAGDWKYDVYTIQANADGLLILTLEFLGIATYCPHDMYVYCYCHPFDPINVEANFYAADDDSGGSLNSAFTPAHNIQLQAGNFYDIVCTHWCSYTVDGLPSDYILTIDSDVTVVTDNPNEIPISDWALGIGIFLIVAATFIRFRRLA